MIFSYLLLTVTFLFSNIAIGHARLKPNGSTPPRDESSGLKSQPCGGAAQTSKPKVYKAGQEISVEWQETINHPGYFKISFSKEGDKFDTVLLAKHVDDQNKAVMSGAFHEFSAKVKLPDIACDKCALQLIQVMEENPKSPSFYYSCSDIKLVKDTAVSPMPAPAPMMEPSLPIDPAPGPAPSAERPSKPQGLQVKKDY